MDMINCGQQNGSQSKCIHIEILQRKSAKKVENNELFSMVFAYLKQMDTHQNLYKCDDENEPIAELVEEITVNHPILINNAKFEDVRFFAYTLNEYAAEVETIDAGDANDVDDVPASQHWILPNREFHGQWEYLYYEEGLKENLLRFSKTIMLFAHKHVDTNAISCNKLVLLHGPPGTGKTSLCKALAQKISIHMKDKFHYTHLFEINSHSLFSKWFSESGKLVQKMFGTIKEVAEDSESLVIILIDEVESIAYARESVSSQEPSDSLRVVNAVLTQLDQLRKHSNVLVLTTSNLSGSIDIAFIDRADLKQFIGYPSPTAIFHIFQSAVDELIKVKIVCGSWDLKMEDSLMDISRKSQGLSGRSLRKLPLLAHAWFINSDSVELSVFLEAVHNAIDKHRRDTIAMAQKKE